MSYILEVWLWFDISFTVVLGLYELNWNPSVLNYDVMNCIGLKLTCGFLIISSTLKPISICPDSISIQVISGTSHLAHVKFKNNSLIRIQWQGHLPDATYNCKICIWYNPNKLDAVRLSCSRAGGIVLIFIFFNWFPVILGNRAILFDLVPNSHAVSLLVNGSGHLDCLLNKWLPWECPIHDHISTFVQSRHQQGGCCISWWLMNLLRAGAEPQYEIE